MRSSRCWERESSPAKRIPLLLDGKRNGRRLRLFIQCFRKGKKCTRLWVPLAFLQAFFHFYMFIGDEERVGGLTDESPRWCRPNPAFFHMGLRSTSKVRSISIICRRSRDEAFVETHFHGVSQTVSPFTACVLKAFHGYVAVFTPHVRYSYLKKVTKWIYKILQCMNCMQFVVV